MRYYMASTGMGILKRQIITNVNQNGEKLEPLYIAGMKVKWYRHFGKYSGSSFGD